MISGAGFFSASLLAVYLYGQFARRSRGKASHALPLQPDQGELDRLIAPLAAAHPGESGLQLIHNNIEAFAIRALSARRAVRSLDLQYYYWKNDLTGSLLIDELLKAANRGVRIRLLLDDINAIGKEQKLLALDEHPHIEIRLFNPSKNRSGAWRRGIEMLLRAFSVNRRMHNKAWIADSRLAIVGGRNIGDAYFDAAQTANFRDLDLLAIGEVVQQAEKVFDQFWNHPVVIPARKLKIGKQRHLPKLQKALLKIVRQTHHVSYLQKVTAQTTEQSPLLNHPIYWTTQAQIIADPPEKAYDRKQKSWLMNQLKTAQFDIKKNLHIISPYFIPGKEGCDELLKLVQRGIEISVLTNSLSATDIIAVHGAYLKYRKFLLKNGLNLFELKGKIGIKDLSLFGSGGASLHTKAFCIDNEYGFIGSFNFDPRSISLNTEMGIFFSQATLVKEIQVLFKLETSPELSYRLGLEHNRIYWQDQYQGNPRLYKKEPEVGVWRKFFARIISFLPIESQL